MTTPEITTPTFEALDRYLRGEADHSERAWVDAWIGQDPERRARLVDLAPILQGDGQVNAAEALRSIKQRIGEVQREDARGERSGNGRDLTRTSSLGRQSLRRSAWPFGITALIVLLLVFSVWRPGPDLGITRMYTTGIGQRATLLLDDGTHVMMAPQTTLRLVRFGPSARTIVVDGDAYFNVATSSRVPFVVQTGMSAIRVLGTSFEVRHYRDDGDIRVAVATGKVLVSSEPQHPAVSITAGQILVVTDSNRTVRTVENIDTEIGWLGDQLVFQHAPVAKILETLTRWYGYEFRYTDSAMARQNITIGLSMRSSREALATLERLLDVNLTIVGDTVTLTPVRTQVVPNHRTKRYDVWVPTREVGR